ncbi:cupin domain-containing protein [Flavobacterium acetivorans]|uniref:cupin domain-containing protein n=1 Tax=Flavobacterium acetivorans TaxID=2893883 RepID=UPI001E3204D0|nr:cupin domain-containing protein [Flavobacterium sp. F-29]UFH34520.1 cupin domain-containing protein [Flavobacterium sp. F-29]
MQEINSINILEKFSLFEKLWTPHIIGELNGQYIKLCKLKNDFVWHSHKEEDEMFVVINGTLIMDIKDGKTISTRSGEILIMPKGEEHRPWTNGEEVMVMLIEPKTTQYTGELKVPQTVEKLEWI